MSLLLKRYCCFIGGATVTSSEAVLLLQLGRCCRLCLSSGSACLIEAVSLAP
ncbi:hypothetical protein HMPREF1556_01158 [Porphyromonas sp. oral taxon 278 str. W7784]|nr:hypothetical protein HMPREF1556_01158 [Porphyromonas sp. oral taxon 278 str. W7784]